MSPRLRCPGDVDLDLGGCRRDLDLEAGSRGGRTRGRRGSGRRTDPTPPDPSGGENLKKILDPK